MPPKKKATKTNGNVEVSLENGTEPMTDVVEPIKNAKKGAAKPKELSEVTNGHYSEDEEDESSGGEANGSSSPPAKKTKKTVAGKAAAKAPTKPKENGDKEPKRKRGAKATAEPAQDSIPEDEELTIDPTKQTEPVAKPVVTGVKRGRRPSNSLTKEIQPG